jgi:glutathione S-transferase
MTTPITLCGFAVSNYYNKVKLSLLEKGIPFTEAEIFPSQSEEMLSESPMGKVPFMRTPQGVLSESQVLTEFIEDNWPEPPLYPRDPIARARCRELIEHIELHLELPARRLYKEAFFGATVSEETKKPKSSPLLEKGLRSLGRVARFGPSSPAPTSPTPTARPGCTCPWSARPRAGSTAGISSMSYLPQAKAYLALIGERPHAQKVDADRKAGMEAYMAKGKK